MYFQMSEVSIVQGGGGMPASSVAMLFLSVSLPAFSKFLETRGMALDALSKP